jgi:hypothetical protein
LFRSRPLNFPQSLFRRPLNFVLPLLAHEVRPCSICGEAVLEVGQRVVSCL